MAVKKGLGKGLDSLITDKVNTKPAASKNNPTPKSEHAADAIMMNITEEAHMVHYNTDSTGTVINQSLCFRTKGEDCIQGVSFRRYPDSRWRKTAAWGSGNVYRL